MTSHASLEAQIAAIADDIAYNTHDVEDGLNAGLITLEDLQGVPLMRRLIEYIRQEYPDLSEEKLRFSLFREFIGALVDDVIATTQAGLRDISPKSPDDVRAAGRQLAVFSQEVNESVEILRQILKSKIYRHEHVLKNLYRAELVISGLFKAYMDRPEFMPGHHGRKWESEADQARHVADIIAGLNDLNSQNEYAELTGTRPLHYEG